MIDVNDESFRIVIHSKFPFELIGINQSEHFVTPKSTFT